MRGGIRGGNIYELGVRSLEWMAKTTKKNSNKKLISPPPCSFLRDFCFDPTLSTESTWMGRKFEVMGKILL